MAGMRVVTWNCCMGTDRKVPAMLDRLRPDIAVVPESSRRPRISEPSLLGDAVPHAWTGTFDNKGLGVFAPTALELFGLQSAYHSYTGHAPGEESAMTLWWRNKEDAGFHCDVVLVPEAQSIEAVSVGGYEEWGAPSAAPRSDHAPVVVDLG